MVPNGSTAILMMLGISAERILPLMAYLIGTFFTPRCLPTNGANAAIGPPSAPPNIAPSAAVCTSVARPSIGTERPVAVRHGTRPMADQGNVEPVERHLTIDTVVDVEDHSDITHSIDSC